MFPNILYCTIYFPFFSYYKLPVSNISSSVREWYVSSSNEAGLGVVDVGDPNSGPDERAVVAELDRVVVAELDRVGLSVDRVVVTELDRTGLSVDVSGGIRFEFILYCCISFLIIVEGSRLYWNEVLGPLETGIESQRNLQSWIASPKQSAVFQKNIMFLNIVVCSIPRCNWPVSVYEAQLANDRDAGDTTVIIEHLSNLNSPDLPTTNNHKSLDNFFAHLRNKEMRTEIEGGDSRPQSQCHLIDTTNGI